MPNPSFSLWLTPPPAVREPFGRLIEALSQRLGTPRFEPHITLCGSGDFTEEEVLARADALAARLAPVPIHLTELGYTDAYFRCLFVRAERSDELLAAHRVACEQFGTPPAPDFMPHLSLVYGTFTRGQKERLMDEMGRRIDMRFYATGLSVCPPAGAPESWRVFGPLPLGGRMPSGERAPS